ncbi:hypothetical protein B0T14DRAFT_192238 [Immersiella caudata]|uniref:Uncharacterized protein n=1 Tax=Immersiella caudata TaxID=314043 RepID=A0AA39WYK8_9PEZI|nr:hypothetical protein B0T14DRAFT_192238 [Immersiella caudata]
MNFRLSVIDLSLDDSASRLTLLESSNLDEVRNFFPVIAPRNRGRRIFILERSGAYLPRRPRVPDGTIEKALSDHLGTPETFFTEHTAQGPAFTANEAHIRSSWLPSSMPADEIFHHDMFSMWLYTGSTKDVQWPCSKSGRRLCPGDEGVELRCDATGRELQFYELKSRPEGKRWLMIVPQRCSYWSSLYGEGGWDTLILCDPPPTYGKVNRTGGPVSLVKRIPFNNGYREFLPPSAVRHGAVSDYTRQELTLIPRQPGEDALAARRRHAINVQRRALQEQLDCPSPPRTCMFDDLRYYFCKHAQLLDIRDHPSCVTLFPLKLIAGHFVVVHDFVAFQTARMRSTGWNLRRETAEQVRAAQEVETAWSRFRCTEYLEAVTSVLDTLDVARDSHHTHPYFYPSPTIYRRATFFDRPRSYDPQGRIGHPETLPDAVPPLHTSDWKSPINDFIYLHRQFSLRREDYDRITTSIAALAGIISGRLGIDEAKTAKALTFVAMCFAPLSWISGVYSMEVFGPDGEFFWQYWATALPTMLAVWGVFFIWKYKWWVVGLRVLVGLWRWVFGS